MCTGKCNCNFSQKAFSPRHPEESRARLVYRCNATFRERIESWIDPQGIYLDRLILRHILRCREKDKYKSLHKCIDTPKSTQIKKVLYLSLFTSLVVRFPPEATVRKSSTTGSRRLFVEEEEEKKVRPISGAQLSKAKVFVVRFLAHVHATKTLGNRMLRSPGHENPLRALFSPSFSRPADLDEFRGSLILFSNVPREAARPARKNVFTIFVYPFCSCEFFLQKVKRPEPKFSS